LKRFQTEPTALEEEIAESHFLEAMIALQTKGIEEAEAVFKLVPHFEQFTIQRSFVEGQIEFFKGRKWRQLTIDLETDPNPNVRMRQSDEKMQQSLPVAPAPVNPQTPILLESPTSPTVPPTAPAPVSPMEEAAIRQFMRPQSVPLVGVFDSDSEVQQQFAAMRAKYAQSVSDDEIVVLPKEDAKTAPEPPKISQDIPVDPVVSDSVMQRVKELRDIANGHYSRAITLFGEVIRLSDSVSLFGRTARLLTALSYEEMGDLKTSNDHLRNVIETFPASQEAVAAGFFLGEHDRAAGSLDAAFRLWGDAFENIRRNPRYTSFWLPKTVLFQRCTTMVREDIEKNRHADALQLLTMLGGVMPPADLAKLKGETYESWAMLLQSQAETTFGEPGNQLAKDTESKRRSAGGAFGELAQLLSDTLEFSNLLWRSAENYRLGKDYRRGIVGYRKFIAANPVGHRPEVNLHLGELYFHLDLLEEASSVLEEALHDFPAHSLTPQLRLMLSHVYYEQKKWDEARALLQLNLIGEASPESASYRDAMYALGNVSFAQGDLEATIPYLEDAIKVHPNAIQAAEAHYTLAQAYLGQAAKHLSEPTENVPAAARQSLESLALEHQYRALAHFAKTEDVLTDRQRVMGLTESEKLMLRNAQFSVCSVLVNMEQYDQVIPRLNALATMYQDRPVVLDALLKMAYALRMTGRETEEQTTLRRAEAILNQLEKTGTISDGTNWRNMIQGQMKRQP
jgi:tetratricopeptide (TPR) repeat protein